MIEKYNPSSELFLAEFAQDGHRQISKVFAAQSSRDREQ